MWPKATWSTWLVEGRSGSSWVALGVIPQSKQCPGNWTSEQVLSAVSRRHHHL